MKCSLCGFEFSGDDALCSGCPVNSGCNTICCPNCGYQTVGESELISWIKKRFKGENKHVSNK